MTHPILLEPMLTFLRQIRKRVVVVGSVARGVENAKDLDILWDIDSATTKQAIQKGIQSLGLKFESPFVSCWTFRDYGWMVELLGVHYGPDYRGVRRRATMKIINGIELFVAQPEDTPVVPNKSKGVWVTWSR